jgi:hypothetical protein
MEAVPTCATSVAVIVACRLLLESTVVLRADPFHFRTAPVAKPVPETVRVKLELPGEAETGLNG